MAPELPAIVTVFSRSSTFEPAAFLWRGRRWRIDRVLQRWSIDTGWWRDELRIDCRYLRVVAQGASLISSTTGCSAAGFWNGRYGRSTVLLATELTPAVTVVTPALLGELGRRLVPAPALLGVARTKGEAKLAALGGDGVIPEALGVVGRHTDPLDLGGGVGLARRHRLEGR